MDKVFTKPLAAITGASSGIGFELAKKFVENGYDIIVSAEDSGIEEAARRLRDMGGIVDAVQANLSTYEGVEMLYAQIMGKKRPLDSIAINAGIGVGGDFTRETRLDDELKMIQLNVISAVHLSKRVARDMVQNGHGRILFTSSIAAVMPAPFLAVYSGTKAFLTVFAEALRNELKDTGVTVTALMPGPTDTNFFNRAHMESTKVAEGKKDDPAVVARQGFEAMMKGKDHIFGGSLNVKIQGAVAEILPDSIKAERQRHVTEPGSSRH